MAIKILLTGFIVLMSVYFIATRTRRFLRREKAQTLLKLIATFLIWGTILVLTLFPYLSGEISQTLGFGENLNTLIFIGFVVLSLAIYKILRAIETLESLISDMVIKDAVRNAVKTDNENTTVRKI